MYGTLVTEEYMYTFQVGYVCILLLDKVLFHCIYEDVYISLFWFYVPCGMFLMIKLCKKMVLFCKSIVTVY